eukprot:CAMPEP_0119322816 /NCGR_PEP_ID=MMETSP1333-20130426/59259_1 /TAXON_ID=418940 /ORGANISM="Scyphosphaera apsteinii, Strain RCC1455" /LENGTH=85 /DNA_ID=CAMNT_0007330143 /DNA_START=213 /DNA_END=466 /DNA_ORIENTATION=-
MVDVANVAASVTTRLKLSVRVRFAVRKASITCARWWPVISTSLEASISRMGGEEESEQPCKRLRAEQSRQAVLMLHRRNLSANTG